MMIKTVYLLLLLMIFNFDAFSQNSKVNVPDEKYADIIERFYVLDSNRTIRNGSYKKSLNGDDAITGSYKNGERNGLWRFYGYKDELDLEINYDNGELTYLETDTLTKEKKHIQSSLTPLGDRPALNLNSKKIYFKYVTSNVKYPRDSEKRHETGRVIISIFLTSQGDIKNYTVSSSSGYKSLDEEALRVLKLIPFDFLPEYKNGIPVDAEVKFPLIFKLPD